ncbi:MAG TPA: tetratricopeptide repeat protein [Vicinamibacterales bacterium]|nr:tetratricopeptide repeat protein [Vicinamibacterales bacterium]
MVRWRDLLLVGIVTSFAAPAAAQKIADAQSRREAIQFYRTGLEFYSSEKFDRAAEEFTKATDKDPLFTLAHYLTGQSYMSVKRYASAIQAFKRCLEASSTLYALAETNRFAVEKQRDDDIREMRESVNALQASGHQLLATRAEQHLADLEKQRTSLNSGYRPPAEVLLSLGSAFFRNGEREAAETEWKAAIEVNPKLGEAHNNLAVIYMTSGRYQEAEAELKAAEKAGYRVNPQFKDDLKKAAAAHR